MDGWVGIFDFYCKLKYKTNRIYHKSMPQNLLNPHPIAFLNLPSIFLPLDKLYLIFHCLIQPNGFLLALSKRHGLPPHLRSLLWVLLFIQFKVVFGIFYYLLREI